MLERSDEVFMMICHKITLKKTYLASVKPIYQIIFFSFLSLHLCSQGKHVDKQPHFGKARCDNYEGYIPYKKELMPLQRVRVVIHIFQKDDGSGNLHNTTKELEFISMMVT